MVLLFGMLSFPLLPGVRWSARGYFLHRNAAFHRANKGAQIAANAFVFVHFGNADAGFARAISVAFVHHLGRRNEPGILSVIGLSMPSAAEPCSRVNTLVCAI